MPFDEIVLEPTQTETRYWRDVWSYRELLWVLAWRDISVRYKQTAIGVAWAIVRPLLTMLVFAIVFGRLAGFPGIEGVAYPLVVFAGLLPWQFFSAGLADGSNSLVANSNLISKVYFPRLIVPLAAIASALVDFAIGLVLMIPLMLCFGFSPDWRILALPGFVAWAILASMGPALWLTALNVQYRDFRYIIPFIVQFGLYISPVGFCSNVIPDRYRLIYFLNPMAGVIDGFRWSLLGFRAELFVPGMAVSAAVTLSLLWLGIRRFRGMEKTFADII